MAELRIKRAVLLHSLDDDELIAGYRAGLRGEVKPTDATFSWSHGWRNGMTDAGKIEIDADGLALARDAIATGYLSALFKAASV